LSVWCYSRTALLGDRLIVISPMVEIKAGEVAEELGIKVYSYAEDIREEL
jgi:hypothetical protein